MKKVFVIGLDSAPPSIIFDRRKEFPALNKLIESGLWGLLRSCHPPITIPAWMVMLTGQDPGSLGLYGFRSRQGTSYTDMKFSFSDSVTEPAIWDIIGNRGHSSCLFAIPPSYPPKPLQGNLVSCFMTPGTDSDYTYPASLKKELEGSFGKYIPDVVFRTEKRQELLESINAMTTQHFDMVEYLIRNKRWNFFMLVEIGLDRIHHAFWKYFDKNHHLYIQDNQHEHVILDYYKLLDTRIGRLLTLLEKDTIVFVVSDHGTKAMKGAFCINEWLIEKGYLVLDAAPSRPCDLEEAEINWTKTKVWGWGGYNARIFFNIKGREETGAIPKSDYEAWRDRLTKELKQLKGPAGEIWRTQVLRPEELYPQLKGDVPDLIAYFDDLNWRSAGTIGHDSLYLPENDKGPDDAMHDWDGIFIMYDPKEVNKGNIGRIDLLDFAPTVLNLMGIPVPEYMKGKNVLERRILHV